ncbi:MAG: hypothetical protein RIQ60_3888 [Pseudomonadota bacterium]|jgi:putative heme iron utilization protein
MDADTATSLRRLLDEQPVAALATLHRGSEPAVSMVPFVLPPGAAHLLIHVSALATHTADMQAHPRVALLVTDEARAGVMPQARARVSLQCEVQMLARGRAHGTADDPGPGSDAAYAAARATYLARFPAAAITFELADFTLARLTPVAARLVAGFGSAHALVGERLQDWLRRR